MTDQKRLEAKVTGLVQGVGFRAFVQREGRRLTLSGYARNCEDRSVEVVAEGPESKLRELERLLRQGPSASRVDWVDARWPAATGEFTGFGIRY